MRSTSVFVIFFVISGLFFVEGYRWLLSYSEMVLFWSSFHWSGYAILLFTHSGLFELLFLPALLFILSWRRLIPLQGNGTYIVRSLYDLTACLALSLGLVYPLKKAVVQQLPDLGGAYGRAALALYEGAFRDFPDVGPVAFLLAIVSFRGLSQLTRLLTRIRTLPKVKKRTLVKNAAAARATHPPQTYPLVESLEGFTEKGAVLALTPDQIVWFELAGRRVYAHTESTQVLVRKSLTELENLLGGHFIRTHRHQLVNLTHVQYYRHWKDGRYLVTMRNGQELEIPRNRKTRFKQMMATLPERS